MSRPRFGTTLFLTVAVMALMLGALSSSAHGAIAGVDKVRMGDEADFGSGSHNFGYPDFGTIKWDYRAVNGIVRVSAQVQGTLYVDKLGSGCARLIVNFQDRDFNNVSSQTIQFCGPGFNANAPANKRSVDISNVPDQRVRRVQLVVGSGPTVGQIVMDQAYGRFSANLEKYVSIDNGAADFNSDVLLVIRDNGRIRGNVSGTLFWDSFSAGCARLIIDFMDVNSASLSTTTVDECAPAGGTWLSNTNRTTVDRSFESASLFKIRVRVGKVSNGSFVGAVATRTSSFGTSNYY